MAYLIKNSEKEIPLAVIEAIQRKFFPDRDQIEKTIRELQYDSLNDCFYFSWAGMYVGIEPDGFMHT